VFSHYSIANIHKLAAIKTKSKLLLIMNKIKKPIFLFIIFSLILISIQTNLTAQNSRDSIPLTKEIINQWTEELSNWGRWGEDDELGTSNLITAQNRKEAASLVTKVISVSLAKDIPKKIGLDSPKPLQQNLEFVEYKG
jgi:hypothetical protein